MPKENLNHLINDYSQELIEIQEKYPYVINFNYNEHLGCWCVYTNDGIEEFDTKEEMYQELQKIIC